MPPPWSRCRDRLRRQGSRGLGATDNATLALMSQPHVTPDYYRFRLIKGESRLDGTLWLINEHLFGLLSDDDYVHGEPPLRLALDAPFSDDSVRRAIKSFDPRCHLVAMAKPKLTHAQYHPRIHRQIGGPEPISVYGHEFTSDLVAFEILERDLEQIFRTIEPEAPSEGRPNQDAYGHEIRRLLILACTEVENLLKQVLLSNEYGLDKKRWETNDYVKVNPVLLLDHYESSLVRYPEYPPIQPFQGWDNSRPTASLDWYDAYNKTKHDRGANLKLATFSRAIAAVAAVHVLLTAQFGFGLIKGRRGRLVMHTDGGRSRIFCNHRAPVVNLEHQYVPWFGEGLGWTAVKYSSF